MEEKERVGRDVTLRFPVSQVNTNQIFVKIH